MFSPALTERSEHVRNKLGDLNTQYFLLALFSSVSIFLPASHAFSSYVRKVIFGGGGTNSFDSLFPEGHCEKFKSLNFWFQLWSLPD